jgi:protein-L-isoaspartate(D-aspartate) O-methyltransferase
MAHFEDARERMVTDQLAARGIRDQRVLDAMRRVLRHAFVPEESRALAYADRALPIGSGQTISQPLMVALMTEALLLTGTERVLEIGTGSGYQAAILAELAREVISIERRPELAETAHATLAALGCSNVQVIVGDGTIGYASAAPFDGILVGAGAPRVPESLKQQLSVTGGRLIIPIGPAEQQQLAVIVRDEKGFTQWLREACVFVPLVGAEAWPQKPDR